MGYITQLPINGGSNLPLLTDIGVIRKEAALKGLWLINAGSGLTDASGNGNTLAIANGGSLPAYASGALQFRIATSTNQFLTTVAGVTGTDETIMYAARNIGPTTNYSRQRLSHGVQGTPSDLAPFYVRDQENAIGRTRIAAKLGVVFDIEYGPAASSMFNTWISYAWSRNATGVTGYIAGTPVGSGTYSSADAFSGTALPLWIGSDAGGNDWDCGFLAVWSRKLTDAEMLSAHKAMRKVMAAKGHVL